MILTVVIAQTFPDVGKLIPFDSLRKTSLAIMDKSL